MLHDGRYEYVEREASTCVCACAVCVLTNTCPPPPPVCADNQVNVDGVCLNRVALGDSCVSPLQCPETATCDDSKCVCQPHFEEIEGLCVKGESSRRNLRRPHINFPLARSER